MKLPLLPFLLHLASARITTKSDLGQHILSHARRLEDGKEADNSWIADYALKFQGCHGVSQWNDEADGEEDVRVRHKRLVRFRLCPLHKCKNDAWGCKSDYGDYVVDMNIFNLAYVEAKDRVTEYACEVFRENECDCEDGDDKDDGFNEEYCEYDCFIDAGKEECVERNPYNDDDEEEPFELENYLECAQIQVEGNDDGNNGRKLEDAEEEVQYFVGPHCASQGGEIRLGLFTDETCSVAPTYYDEDGVLVEDDGGSLLYESLIGKPLPYANESFVSNDCFSCEDAEVVNENDDYDDEERLLEEMQELYIASGKCEGELASSDDYSAPQDPNNVACNYISGIKLMRADGIIEYKNQEPSRVYTVLILSFAACFFALCWYTWYLKKKLQMARILSLGTK